jgi:glutathione S-transferase
VLKLFTAHNSICTQKVFLTLLEKDLPWISEYIDLFNNEQYRPDYLRLNPKGVVPTLIHEGRAIIESTLICEYLDEVFLEPSLVPKTPHERSQMRRWSKHIDEGVFEATREISFSAMFPSFAPFGPDRRYSDSDPAAAPRSFPSSYRRRQG